MNHVASSAPGKLFLCGEYAVLEGGPAVVTAVDRRALARLSGKRHANSPVLKAVYEAVANFLANDGEISHPEQPHVLVDTGGFGVGRHKLGLGSSAAVAAAATGLLLESAGKPIGQHLDDIIKLAVSAHRAAQGGGGSGADVVTSVMGGTVLFGGKNVPRPLDKPRVFLSFAWTGKSASTPALLDKLADFKRYDLDGYNRHIDSLAKLAGLWVNAYESGNADDVVSVTGQYALGMERLGVACGAPIVTGEHARLGELARACGGDAKPSGAGGGDTAVAVFTNGDDARRFGDECVTAGFSLLDLKPHTDGLRTEQI